MPLAGQLHSYVVQSSFQGHFLQILLTNDDLIGERPYSLAVDHMDTLWVGNERAQIKIFRYLLNTSHIV